MSFRFVSFVSSLVCLPVACRLRSDRQALHGVRLSDRRGLPWLHCSRTFPACAFYGCLPGCALTYLPAFCSCLPGRALLASGLPVASSRFGPSGLSLNCLPGCALTCLSSFCSSPRFRPFTLPSGCTFSCPRAPCGLFSVRTIRVIPKLPSGLCPDLPPRFLLPSLVRTFHPPLGLYLFLPPGSLWPLLGSDHPGYPQTAFRVVP